MAIIDGTRELICKMPVPSLMRSVFAAMKASGTTASMPQASADQAKSTPRRSAAQVYSTNPSQSSPL